MLPKSNVKTPESFLTITDNLIGLGDPQNAIDNTIERIKSVAKLIKKLSENEQSNSTYLHKPAFLLFEGNIQELKFLYDLQQAVIKKSPDKINIIDATYNEEKQKSCKNHITSTGFLLSFYFEVVTLSAKIHRCVSSFP